MHECKRSSDPININTESDGDWILGEIDFTVICMATVCFICMPKVLLVSHGVQKDVVPYAPSLLLHTLANFRIRFYFIVLLGGSLSIKFSSLLPGACHPSPEAVSGLKSLGGEQHPHEELGGLCTILRHYSWDSPHRGDLLGGLSAPPCTMQLPPPPVYGQNGVDLSFSPCFAC